MRLYHYIIYITAALIFLASCAKENISPSPSAEPGTVTLDISPVFSDKDGNLENGTITKSLGEAPTIKKLYVAVFDQGDILTQIVEAIPGTSADPRNQFEHTGEGNRYRTYFHVTLTATSESREVQFIAVGQDDLIDINDFDMIDEASFIKKFIVTGGVDAYWCRKHFDGINEHSDMKELQMIRNFLKVTVSLSDGVSSKFVFEGFRVFNKPRYGTLAPYNPNSPEYIYKNGEPYVNFDRFADYKDLASGDNSAYNNLTVNQGYTGYMPQTVEYISLLDEAAGADTEDWFSRNMLSLDDADYLYECSFTSVDNPFIIFKGRYTGNGGSGKSTYYKADFVYQKEGDTEKKYFNLLRNFHFELIINAILNDGAATVLEAANGASMNNFDGSTSSQDLTNISVAGARMHISTTNILETNESEVTLYIKNLTGENYTVDSNKDIYVKSVSATTGSNGESLIRFDGKSYDITISPTNVTYNGSEGWRKVTIRFSTSPASLEQGVTWKQSIVFANADENGLTRTVNISIRRPFTFSVDAQDYVEATEGAPCAVDIAIPSGFTVHRFPLKFFIEPEEKTLYPDATAASYPMLPVVSSYSIIPGSEAIRTYYFVRTITEAEYDKAEEDIMGYKTFRSYFKSLVPGSSTRIWVMADPSTTNYFESAVSDSFVNERTPGRIIFENNPFIIEVGESIINPVTTNSGATISYSINNTAVATVDARTGMVVGVSEGEAVITATMPDYKAFSGATTTYTVKVVHHK
ncbi:MAG: Ig-like domain-containing protein [Bacteroidales bacterium]|nr:Ig-like domain-containing protein [Bacteroidales bacterium]